MAYIQDNASQRVTTEIEHGGFTYRVSVDFIIDHNGDVATGFHFGHNIDTGSGILPAPCDEEWWTALMALTRPRVDVDQLRKDHAERQARPGYGVTRCG